MAEVYDGIGAELAAWIEQQPVFVVATAPLAANGLVNLSPKGAIGVETARRPYLRAVIVVDMARVSDSCGYAVPRMELLQERETLDRVWRTRDDERIATYRAERNATSLDGPSGLDTSIRHTQAGAEHVPRDVPARVRPAHRSGDAASPASV